VGASLGNLGTIAHMRGDFEAAVGYYTEAIEASREAGDEDGSAVNLHNLGRSELALGRAEQGLEALRESLAIGRRLGYREVIAYCLGGLAELAMIEQDAARAAMLLGASGGLFSDIGATLSPDEAQTQERVAAYVVDELGPERTDELRAEGAATALDELLDEVASGT
jgi:tetratricopeptide (TPR) repeat protein